MQTQNIVVDTEDVNNCTNNNLTSLYPIWLRKLSEDYPTPLNEQQRLTFQRFVAQRVHKYSVIHKQCNVIRKGWRSLRQVIDTLQCEKAQLEKSLAFNQKQSTVKSQKLLSLTVQTTNSNSLSNITNNTISSIVNSNVNTQGQPQTLTQTSTQTTTTTTIQNAVIKRPQRSIRRSAMFANMQNVLHRATKEAADTVATVTAKREQIAKQTRLSIVDDDLNVQRVLIEPLQQKLQKVTVVQCEAEKEVTQLLTLLHDMMSLETVYCSSFSLKAAGSLPLQDVMSNLQPSHTSKSQCGKQQQKQQQQQFKSFMYDIHFQPACHTPQVEDIIRSQIEEMLDSYVAYRARLDPILHKRLEEEEVKRAAKVHDLLQLIGLNEQYDNDNKNSNRNFAMPHTSTHFQDNLAVLQNTVQGAMYNSTQPFLPPLDVSANEKQNIMFISDSDSDAESDEHLRKLNNNDSEIASVDNKRDRARIQSALAALDDFEEMY